LHRENHNYRHDVEELSADRDKIQTGDAFAKETGIQHKNVAGFLQTVGWDNGLFSIF